jgi:hypothetical protein
MDAAPRTETPGALPWGEAVNEIGLPGVEYPREASMRKGAAVSLLAAALLVVGAAPGEARHRAHPTVGARVFVGFGPTFWWGAPFPRWYYYPPPYYMYTPPPVIVREPPVYIEQPSPPPPSPPPAQAYWHYCASSQAYYPNVQTCPEPWIKVPPRPE